MTLILTVLILTTAPPAIELTDHCDIIERNHYHDSRGCLILTQWVFWEWSSTRKRFQVVAWRMASSNKVRSKGKLAELRFVDGAQCRRIVAGEYRETWTLHDPEVRDREFLWREGRRGLSRNP